MRLIFQLFLAMTILGPTFGIPAHAQNSTVYVVTYVEVLPNAVTSGAALLERYRDAGRKEAGNLRFDVLHEIARPTRFAILEVWQDKAALDGDDIAASTLRFRDGLKAIGSAPYDERIHSGVDIGPEKSERRAGAIHVLTHVDVLPAYQDGFLGLLKAMSIDTHADPGNMSYEVLQQMNLANHFTVVEEWTRKKALEAHIAAAHTREFRKHLLPMEGALYDERIYKELD